MNNVTGRGESHWACVQKKGGSSSSSFTTPFSFHSPPLLFSPNPLAASRTAEGQGEEKKKKKRREAKTQRGRGRDRGGVLGCT